MSGKRKIGNTPIVPTGGVPRVNLLPQEISEKRTQKKLLKAWGVRVVYSIILLVAVIGGMFAWQTFTTLSLSSVEAEGSTLLMQIQEKAEIGDLIEQETKLSDYQISSMATDILWGSATGKILEKFPDDAWLCGYQLTSGTAAVEGEPTNQTGLSGIITVCGEFPSATPYLRDATTVDGVLEAFSIEGKYEERIMAYGHKINIRFDQTIYTNFVENREVEIDDGETPDLLEEQAE